MNLFGTVVFFLIVWWLVFFATLPFGINRLENPEPGMERGAPERPRLWLKAGVTTLIAGAITVAVYLASEAGLLSLRDWFAP